MQHGPSDRLEPGLDSGGSRLPERVGARDTAIVLVLVIATAVGAALRLSVAGQSLFADELSTYWILDTNGLWGVVSTVHTDAEITPPLFFVLSWFTTRIELTPELLRAPAVLAGSATIPLVYFVGARTVGRAAGLVAAALTALAPFMIFYSAEGRGYGLAMALVTLSTLALLVAADGGGARWWAVYAAASCGAMLTHYTMAFVLAGQLVWVLWAHPQARRPALVANAAAALGFLPWLTGLKADLDSPTTDILSALAPVTLDTVTSGLAHWSVGYPYQYASTGLLDLPGPVALVLLGLGVTLAAAGLALRAAGEGLGRRLSQIDRGLVLVVVLALATPVGTVLASAIGTNVFGVRNLAGSWPGLALALAALLVACGPRLRVAAVTLVLASFAIGAVKMLDDSFARPGLPGRGRAGRPGRGGARGRHRRRGGVSRAAQRARRRARPAPSGVSRGCSSGARPPLHRPRPDRCRPARSPGRPSRPRHRAPSSWWPGPRPTRAGPARRTWPGRWRAPSRTGTAGCALASIPASSTWACSSTSAAKPARP